MHTIGILGGMGPEATILLQERLLAAMPEAQDDSDHIPLLIDMNPAVPSRIKHLIEGQGDDPGPVLARMARRLEAAGAKALAMPCNTAHHYAPAIRAATRLPFLNMVELSCASLPPGPVGILASPATKLAGVFDAALAARGAHAIWPEDQGAMLAAIRHIKANGPSETSRATLRAASQELVAKGAHVQLIGCSEFSLIAEAVSDAAEATDTLDMLVAAIKAFAQAA